jgi:hypothetical protein
MSLIGYRLRENIVSKVNFTLLKMVILFCLNSMLELDLLLEKMQKRNKNFR